MKLWQLIENIFIQFRKKEILLWKSNKSISLFILQYTNFGIT